MNRATVLQQSMDATLVAIWRPEKKKSTMN
ncbi:UNVERIFIED_ORG: hypothetical protein ABIC58_001562 [Leuconostoc holzapfelii]